MIEIKPIYQYSHSEWRGHSIPLNKNPAGCDPRGSAGAWLLVQHTRRDEKNVYDLTIAFGKCFVNTSCDTGPDYLQATEGAKSIS
jgi:hypothetical protein